MEVVEVAVVVVIVAVVVVVIVVIAASSRLPIYRILGICTTSLTVKHASVFKAPYLCLCIPGKMRMSSFISGKPFCVDVDWQQAPWPARSLAKKLEKNTTRTPLGTSMPERKAMTQLSLVSKRFDYSVLSFDCLLKLFGIGNPRREISY